MAKPFVAARFLTPGPLTPRLIEVVARPWFTSGRLESDARSPWSVEYDVTENGIPVEAGFLGQWGAEEYIEMMYPGSKWYPGT